MKILQLNLEKGWRGGERQTLFCMQEFAKAGHEVHLLARTGQALAQHAKTQGLTVHNLNKPYQILLWLLLHGRQYDIIHAQTANSLSWAAMAKAFLPGKLVFTRRTAFPLCISKLKRTLLKWRKADLFVSISELAAEEPRRYGIHPLIIPSAIQAYTVDPVRAKTFKASLAHLDNKIIIGTTSALTREKDPLSMIQTIALLKAKGFNIVFLHFGHLGEMRTACVARIKQLGLEQEYRLLGFHEYVEDYISLLDIFTMSSTFEALGSSVLDAFWQKVPVVSTQAGGLKEVLADGRGLLCPVSDPQSMAEAISQLITQPEQRQEMIEKAHAYVQAKHLVEPMGRAYLEAFTALTNSPTH